MPQRKLAVFTEGATELVFMKKLLEEIAGRRNITFEVAKQKWNQIITLESSDDEFNEYFALLVDCGQDEQVVSCMLEQAETLCSANYDAVIGIRDLYPRARDDFQFLKEFWEAELAVCEIPAEVFATVMEIESWFIQEWSHFERYDPALTTELIEQTLGFNPQTQFAELLDHPSDFLDQAYKLVGHSYTKKAWQQQAVVDHLDMDRLYLEMPSIIAELDRLIAMVDTAYSQNPN